jgi:hypothetical protein
MASRRLARGQAFEQNQRLRRRPPPMARRRRRGTASPRRGKKAPPAKTRKGTRPRRIRESGGFGRTGEILAMSRR